MMFSVVVATGLSTLEPFGRACCLQLEAQRTVDHSLVKLYWILRARSVLDLSYFVRAVCTITLSRNGSYRDNRSYVHVCVSSGLLASSLFVSFMFEKDRDSPYDVTFHK
jgi:hypothetical protein